MANTSYLKKEVEEEIREQLKAKYGQEFSKKFITLPMGGRHEFDAVSKDGTIIAAIKSASGLTSGGNIPSAKIRDIESELYYLMLAEVKTKLLIMTNVDFYNMLTNNTNGKLKGKVHPSIRIEHYSLPSHIANKVRQIQMEASKEMKTR